MRLTSQQVETIKSLVCEQFGTHAQVWLFGSRVNDEKRGGDIDLYIVPEQFYDTAQSLDKQITLSTQLKIALGDQRIDLVIDDGTPQIIYQVACTQGILL